MAEAGFGGEDGGRIVEILYNTSENHRLIAEALQEIWRTELGIDVRLTNQETGVFFDNRRQLNFDICRGSWFGDFLDPYSFLEIFTSGNSNNLTGWANADYDRLVDEARAEAETEKRNDLFAQAETILLTESPIIPIYVYSTVRLADPRVQGWHGNLLDQHPHKALYFEPAKQ
jgi:oligopeptide transport system substrate-binding protein